MPWLASANPKPFRASTADVRKPTLLCAPTNKSGEDPGAPTHPDHLQDYRIRPAVAFTTVANQRVDDQFGTHFVDVRKPVSLQVPTAKSHSASPPEPTNPAVDHFQCYKVSLAQGAATTITGVTTPEIAGRSGHRLDTMTGDRVQTVVVWPSKDNGLVNVVITNDLPDPKIQAAIDAFGGG